MSVCAGTGCLATGGRQVVEAFAALRPAAVDGEVIPMSPQSRERLKALGYLE